MVELAEAVYSLNALTQRLLDALQEQLTFRLQYPRRAAWDVAAAALVSDPPDILLELVHEQNRHSVMVSPRNHFPLLDHRLGDRLVRGISERIWHHINPTELFLELGQEAPQAKCQVTEYGLVAPNVADHQGFCRASELCPQVMNPLRCLVEPSAQHLALDALPLHQRFLVGRVWAGCRPSSEPIDRLRHHGGAAHPTPEMAVTLVLQNLVEVLRVLERTEHVRPEKRTYVA
eukprot:4203874-Pyramimonas_sp.AAC.1